MQYYLNVFMIIEVKTHMFLGQEPAVDKVNLTTSIQELDEHAEISCPYNTL